MAMTLNPLSLLETAINEHGSATILRERVALVRDQLAATEQKLVDANTLLGSQLITIGQLNATIEQLALQVRKQQSEIDDLKNRLNPPLHDNLHNNENLILAKLATVDGPSIDELASVLRIGPQTIEMHLDTLATYKLVESSDSYLKTKWRLTISGKRLMASRGTLH